MRFLPMLLAGAIAAPAVAAADSKPAQPGADRDKLVCKREVPVGSLIASRKRCMTKAQWDALARDGNEEARKMVYENMGRPPGN